MVNLTIDKLPVSVKEGTTLMEAAESIGIHIPHLCYWKGLNEIAACRVCVVELEGRDHLITACNNKVEEGMVVYTNSPKVRLDRRLTVQLILSQHDCRCATCVRSGNCSLQKIATDLNVQDGLFEERLEKQPWVTAANIDEYLGYHHEITCDIEIPIPNNNDHTPCGRVELSEREASERKHDFEGVENCMNKKEIAQESGRCLRCDHFGFGIFKGGREKLW